MASNEDIIDRWVREVRKDDPRYLRPANSNVQVDEGWTAKRARLYSYGSHFELARWVDATDVHDGFWLLNGDRYSVSTSRHQSLVRNSVQRAGGSIVTLPYSSLSAAGIELDSIVPAEITSDRWINRSVTVATLDDVPESYRPGSWRNANKLARQNDDGTWTYQQETHVLGESVFTAEYQIAVPNPNGPDPIMGRWTTQQIRATFLSAFDHQERTRHYFLCQLPDSVNPGTVAEAFEALKPDEVMAAEAAGRTVTRQGDLFAVPVDLTTREIRKLGATVKGERVLGISHTASESVTVPGGRTFARGILRHSPFESWRQPEHRRQRMGDGKVWHLLVKNTVPTDARGANRAWSLVGNID